METESYSALLALSTYPHFGENEYIELIQNNFKNQKENRISNYYSPPNDFDVFFTPKTYHIFGKFDLAFFSLIDHLTITSKVFFPTDLKDSNSKIELIKSQIITGIIPKNCCKLSEIYENENDFSFITITNLKLNNGFLLGEGYNFVEIVLERLKSIIESHENTPFLILNSFGIFELTLLMWGNDPQKLSKIIRVIREEKIGEFNGLENSLYKQRKDIRNYLDKLCESNLVTETQSYLGVELIPNKSTFPKYRFKDNHITDLKTEIEWSIKSGHFHNVVKLVKTMDDIFDIIDINDVEFIMGKTDYIFKEKSNKFENNRLIYNILRSNEDIKKQIRSIRTKVRFNIDKSEIEKALEEEFKPEYLKNSEYLKQNTYEIKDIANINSELKKLKISKILRYRILKVFYNFNNAIQNPVIYNLFIDFIPFIKNFKELIYDNAKKVESFYGTSNVINNLSVDEIETTFTFFEELFEDAFYLRYINDYNLDEINDFVVTYNSPIQQLITGLDNLFKITNYFLLHGDGDKILTRINTTQTVASKYSVNFSLYNLYEPGILLTLFTKEVFNSAFKDLDEEKWVLFKKWKRTYKKYWKNYLNNYSNEKIYRLKSTILNINLNYFFIDYYRYKIFFKGDFKLFFYWHMSVNFQLPSYYTISGNMDKEYICKELIRLLFLAKVIDIRESKDEYIDHVLNSVTENSLKQDWNFYGNLLRNHISNFVEEFKVELVVESSKKNEKPNFYDILTNMETIVLDAALIDVDEEVCELIPDFYNKFDESEDYIKFINKINVEDELELGKLSIELIYWYLNKIYKNNGPIPYLLQRNWVNGKVYPPKSENINNIENIENLFYLLDSTGGVWFHSYEKMKEYSYLRNKFLISMMHISHLYKPMVIEKYKIGKNDVQET